MFLIQNLNKKKTTIALHLTISALNKYTATEEASTEAVSSSVHAEA